MLSYGEWIAVLGFLLQAFVGAIKIGGQNQKIADLDRAAVERSRQIEALWKEVEELRKEQGDHVLEDARTYASQEDLKGLYGRLDVVLDRVNRVAASRPRQ